jgi:glutathione-regulated potassium-efflux system ancillary protein KefG
MNRILIIFAHPRFEKSRVNSALLAAIQDNPAVTLNDLYELYPAFNIDVEREKALLTAHRVLVWQHPFYMYSAPALLKQWIDLVWNMGGPWPGGRCPEGQTGFQRLTSAGHGRSTRRAVTTALRSGNSFSHLIRRPPVAG